MKTINIKRKKIKMKRYIRDTTEKENTVRKTILLKDDVWRNVFWRGIAAKGMSVALVTECMLQSWFYGLVDVKETGIIKKEKRPKEATDIYIDKDTYLAVNLKMDALGLNNINSLILQLIEKYDVENYNFKKLFQINLEEGPRRILPLADIQRKIVFGLIEKKLDKGADDKRRTLIRVDAKLIDEAKKKAKSNKDKMNLALLSEKLLKGWFCGLIKFENNEKPAERIRMTEVMLDRTVKTCSLLKLRAETGGIDMSLTIQALLNYYIDNNVDFDAIDKTSATVMADKANSMFNIRKPAAVVTADNYMHMLDCTDAIIVYPEAFHESIPYLKDKFMNTRKLFVRLMEKCEPFSFRRFLKYAIKHNFKELKDIIVDVINEDNTLYNDKKVEIIKTELSMHKAR